MDNEDYEPLLADLGVGYYDLSGNFQYGVEPDFSDEPPDFGDFPESDMDDLD